jgi:hypothetical protein
MVVADLAPVQLDPSASVLSSLPVQLTSRVRVDSPNPQLTLQSAKGCSVQENVTHAAVAAHVWVGLAPAQLDPLTSTPSLPMHITGCSTSDTACPQAVGQGAGLETCHAYTTNTVQSATCTANRLACVPDYDNTIQIVPKWQVYDAWQNGMNGSMLPIKAARGIHTGRREGILCPKT